MAAHDPRMCSTLCGGVLPAEVIFGFGLGALGSELSPWRPWLSFCQEDWKKTHASHFIERSAPSLQFPSYSKNIGEAGSVHGTILQPSEL